MEELESQQPTDQKTNVFRTTAPFFEVKNKVLEGIEKAKFYYREANTMAMRRILKPELIARFITYVEDLYMTLKPNLIKNNYKLKTDYQDLKEIDNFMVIGLADLTGKLNNKEESYKKLIQFNEYLSKLIVLADEIGFTSVEKERKDFTTENVTEEFLFARYGM